jgi:prepilin-type N-terminal cleavage/methylation domain-containing protein
MYDDSRMRSPQSTRHRRGFTLVELLVVIGIIALLISILLPALSKARIDANRTRCRAELHDLGVAFTMYLNDSRNHLPWLNVMPSVVPKLNNSPTIVELLAPYEGTVKKAYRCPSDMITFDTPGAPGGFETYFERETSSYQYDAFLAANYAGHSILSVKRYHRGHQNLVNIMSDYEAFHGKPGTAGAMNHLFADSHVGDMDGM